MPQLAPILPFAVASCIALGGALWSAVMLLLVRQQHRAERKRVATDCAQREATWDAALKNLAQQVEDLTVKLQDCEAQIPQSRAAFAGGTSSKTTLNLTRRAQALRMHRRGDEPDQIGKVLDIPLQEVNLLLKVHRIVLDHL